MYNSRVRLIEENVGVPADLLENEKLLFAASVQGAGYGMAGTRKIFFKTIKNICQLSLSKLHLKESVKAKIVSSKARTDAIINDKVCSERMRLI